ncbi:uncharacterized protein LOC125529920 [Triticum urartu]|uniref:uncharacterized protein LOC125529920 n=1 Tax=Triticum urartu TaxID=4572 RepID=UPI002044234A|nr:uncharacterized protein LOC125529920 [Triticum urartu]
MHREVSLSESSTIYSLRWQGWRSSIKCTHVLRGLLLELHWTCKIEAISTSASRETETETVNCTIESINPDVEVQLINDFCAGGGDSTTIYSLRWQGCVRTQDPIMKTQMASDQHLTAARASCVAVGFPASLQRANYSIFLFLLFPPSYKVIKPHS